jgi:hypothetical protein
MAIFLLTLGIFALFFALMSVRLIFIKNGEFRGTCATQSPFLAKEGLTCGYCGRTIGEEECPNAGKPELKEMPVVRKS